MPALLQSLSFEDSLVHFCCFVAATAAQQEDNPQTELSQPPQVFDLQTLQAYSSQYLIE